MPPGCLSLARWAGWYAGLVSGHVKRPGVLC